MAGLENLKHEIEHEAEKGARKLLEEAEHEAGELVKSAEKDAKLREKRAEAEVAGLLAAEKAERIAAARLEAKKIITEGQEEAIKESLAKVWHEFAKLAKGKDYHSLLRKLIREGIAEVGGKALVHVRREDAAVAKECGAEVSERHLECAGGAIIESRDARVRVNSTLEQIFEDRRDEIRKEIYGKLFSGKRKE